MAQPNGSKRVLITGASDGIGLLVAKRFADDGAKVIGTGTRSKSDLPSSFPDNVIYRQLDMASPNVGEEVRVMLDAEGWSDLDHLILNAGIGKTCDPTEELAEDILLTMSVNLVGPIALSHTLFPLLKQASGTFTVIGSVAHKGAGNFASYAASKAGLHGFVRALSEEWRGQVSVQIVHPGPVSTNMHQKAGLDTSKFSKFFLKPEFAARKIHSAVLSGKPFSTVSFLSRELDARNWLARFGMYK